MVPTHTPRSVVSGVVLAVASLIAGFPLSSGSAAAQEADTASTVEAAERWGPMPPPADSVTGVFEDHPTPLWESVLLVPYRVVGLPLRWTVVGIQRLAEASSNEVTRTVVDFFRREGRYQVRPSVKLGGLAGFGGGLTLGVEPFLWNGSRMRLRGSATFPGDRRADLGILGPVSRSGQIQLGAGFRRRHNARFFGIGPDTDEADLSVFEREELWAGAGLGWELGGGLYTEGTVFWSRIGAFPAGTPDGGPRLEATFDELPVGFGRFSRGITTGLAVSHDNARNRPRPNGGGMRRIRAAYFVSDDAITPDHWSYRVEAQHFFTLLSPDRVLAVRAMGSWLDTAPDEPLPFQRLTTNDEPDLMRGYDDFRWQDRGLAIFSAEYRWPLWVWSHTDGIGVDVLLLTDVGQPFRDRTDLTLNNLKTSYGVGFRALGTDSFLGTLTLAWSDEQWVVRLRGEQVFQEVRNAIFHGGSRVPNR